MRRSTTTRRAGSLSRCGPTPVAPAPRISGSWSPTSAMSALLPLERPRSSVPDISRGCRGQPRSKIQAVTRSACTKVEHQSRLAATSSRSSRRQRGRRRRTQSPNVRPHRSRRVSRLAPDCGAVATSLAKEPKHRFGIGPECGGNPARQPLERLERDGAVAQRPRGHRATVDEGKRAEEPTRW